jgi:7 transmembrane helices usually fused to an inactive transglutaminase
MRNRRAPYTAVIVLFLVATSVALYLLRPKSQPQTERLRWQITLIVDGRAQGSSVQDEIPRDPAALFSDRSSGESVSYQIQRIATPNATADHGWFAANHRSADERRLIEFLLLLPAATLLVCFFRNVVGLSSFGTFAPALLGLAFREVNSLFGVFLVLSIITVGWWLRRGLNELHLLQVPRSALLLSCVVVMLLILLSVTGKSGPAAITLFPLVILTGMIERFWSMEEDEGAGNSIGTLGATLFMAGCVWLLASNQGVSDWMLAHPETLGVVMAGQLLLGRYTGFRLVELYRFRTLINEGSRAEPSKRPGHNVLAIWR